VKVPCVIKVKVTVPIGRNGTKMPPIIDDNARTQIRVVFMLDLTLIVDWAFSVCWLIIALLSQSNHLGAI